MTHNLADYTMSDLLAAVTSLRPEAERKNIIDEVMRRVADMETRLKLAERASPKQDTPE